MSEKIVNPGCNPQPYKKSGYKSFQEFYPYYLGEHHNRTNRRLHLISTTNSIMILLFAFLSASPHILSFILLALAQGYGFAWIGHFFFEKNKPATFNHPIYSFMGDMRLWWEVVGGRRRF
ncbi:unnamed protein product [Orchesella dallaii]|uniref:DUF962 domain-containing protein n=1 Tax=Orchesella dallaii TaxID=48710 RepID=A0ABP1R1B4_9HEXA